MEVYTIAAVLKKKNATHAAEEIAGVLEAVYQTRYNISLKKEVAYISSKTCNAAKNVSKNLDAEQVSNIFLFQQSTFNSSNSLCFHVIVAYRTIVKCM